MNNDQRNARDAELPNLRQPLRVLTVRLIEQIDAALAGLGPFAEVRLIKDKGRLRFIQKLESESVANTGMDEIRGEGAVQILPPAQTSPGQKSSASAPASRPMKVKG